MSNSQVLATFGAKLHVPAVLRTASGLPINVEGHFCKMLTVQAVPTAQCLRLGPTEFACQSFSAVRYIIDVHKYAKRYDFVGVTTQRRIITVRLSLGTSMAIMRRQFGALQDRASLDSMAHPPRGINPAPRTHAHSRLQLSCFAFGGFQTSPCALGNATPCAVE